VKVKDRKRKKKRVREHKKKREPSLWEGCGRKDVGEKSVRL
jgi:hypothetical protein